MGVAFGVEVIRIWELRFWDLGPLGFAVLIYGGSFRAWGVGFGSGS